MDRRIDNRKDILLLLLYSPGKTNNFNEPISGRTRLMKMIFLFKKEMLDHFKKGTDINEINFYDFFPWNFGPFSKDVYDDLTFFIYRKYIIIKKSNEEMLPESAAEWDEWNCLSETDVCENDITVYEEEEYQLTDKGMKYTHDLYVELSSTQIKLLKEFKSRTVKIPLRALLKYVYENYSDMTTNSKIKDDLLGV